MKKPAEKLETHQPSPSPYSGRCAMPALPLPEPSMAMRGCMFACIFAPVLRLYLCLCVSCVSTIYAEKRLKLTAFNMHNNTHTHEAEIFALPLRRPRVHPTCQALQL